MLRAALTAFVLIVATAVYSGIGVAIGPHRAAGAALLVAWLLTIAAAVCVRRQPVAICFDENVGWIAAFDRAGRFLAEGRITGCTQWSNVLLVLEVTASNRRARMLLVPADALDLEPFRTLSVWGRYGVVRSDASR